MVKSTSYFSFYSPSVLGVTEDGSKDGRLEGGKDEERPVTREGRGDIEGERGLVRWLIKLISSSYTP